MRRPDARSAGRARSRLGLVVLAACVLAAGSLVSAQPAAAQMRPNVVVVMTDDQRWDALDRMPTVQEELVGKGVTFANAFASDPLCCPSRATFLTGLHAHSTQVYRNGPPLGGYGWFDDSSTFATWLEDAGYRTAYVGKYLVGYDRPDVPPGWNRWLATVNGYFDYTVSDDGAYVSFGSAPEDYSTDVYTDTAVSFLEADAEQPFLLVYAPFAPHFPSTPAPRHVGTLAGVPPSRPPSFDEADIGDKPRWVHKYPRLTEERQAEADALRRSMLESLLAVDDGVGRILDALEASGRLRDTIVVYTSDNGLLLGEHRQVNRKTVPYEESIRIPFVVRYDALGHGVRTEGRLVTNLDLAPTLAALAGAAAPRVEGRSLVPVLESAPATAWRSRFLIEHLRGTQGNPREVPTYCGVRSARWKYVVYKTQEEELYDLAADPDELRNLARSAAHRTSLLKLRRWVRRLCSPPPPGFSLEWLCTHETTAARRAAGGSRYADTLCGAGRNDLLFGRGGRDSLLGRARNDRLDGGEGGDVLDGGRGDDRLRGGAGPDLVDGGPGRDVLLGGAGNDVFRARDGRRDLVGCGAGRDAVHADARDRVAADCEVVRRPLPPKLPPKP